MGGDAAWFRWMEGELIKLQPNWLCRHAEDAAKARSVLASHNFDAVILEAGMSSGADVLDNVAQHSPGTLRSVRCNIWDRATFARWNRPGVIPMSMDGDATALAAHLKRAARLHGWMLDPAIGKLLPLLRKLPAMPRLHLEATRELQSANGSLDVVARSIAQDPVMAAKILQVVNSAYFSPVEEVTDTAQAVMFLGADRTRALILLAGIFSQFDRVRCPGFCPDKILTHSLQVATFASQLAATETKDEGVAETAFTAGLLHDIGKLMLAGNEPELYASIRQHRIREQVSQRDAELALLGTTHAELGACLLGTWGLPLAILEAIAWHHQPDRSDYTGFTAITAVHAANIIAGESAGTDVEGGPFGSMDHTYLVRIGLGGRRNSWREICGVPARPEEDTAQENVRRRSEARQN